MRRPWTIATDAAGMPLTPHDSRHGLIPETGISGRDQPVMQTAQPALADTRTEA